MAISNLYWPVYKNLEKKLLKLAECVHFADDQLNVIEYYGAAEPPVRCGESHLSGLTEPPQFVY